MFAKQDITRQSVVDTASVADAAGVAGAANTRSSHRLNLRHGTRIVSPILLAVCLTLTNIVAALPPTASQAQAQTYRSTAILQDQTEIERLTNALEDAELQLSGLNTQIAQIEAQIPVAQQRAAKSVVTQYKSQSDWIATLCSIFDTRNFGTYLTQLNYVERISSANARSIQDLRDLKSQIEDLKTQVVPTYETIISDLHAEQTSRSNNQSAGIALSTAQAKTLGGEASIGVAAHGGTQPDDYREAATDETDMLDDHANWFASRDEFITHWAERIDAYLEGTPLAGQGANFAQAAWKYNVDPRWSPAISYTESSNGRFCIRPHNAWGWGAADSDPYGLAFEWASWEEAIDEHVKGLADGYGYTISIKGARMYCPNTWQSWYNKTLNQMSLI